MSAAQWLLAAASLFAAFCVAWAVLIPAGGDAR
jgi:hypothetical protein